MTSTNPRNADEEARTLTQAWFTASMENDDDWFAQNGASEFRYLMGDGAVAPLEVIVPFSHRIRDKHYGLLDVTGHRYDRVLVANGTYTARGTLPADAVAAEQVAKYAKGVEVRFTQVWVDDESGRPRCVLMQSTNVV